jgi:hypothetical protein
MGNQTIIPGGVTATSPAEASRLQIKQIEKARTKAGFTNRIKVVATEVGHDGMVLRQPGERFVMAFDNEQIKDPRYNVIKVGGTPEPNPKSNGKGEWPFWVLREKDYDALMKKLEAEEAASELVGETDD